MMGVYFRYHLLPVNNSCLFDQASHIGKPENDNKNDMSGGLTGRPP